MEIDGPNRTTNTSDLFICFKSHISNSSSMCLSSKSILSHNSSLRRGAQSPSMFPKSTQKNRGSSVFTENPEPTSPKVTCIGQVRVKTKKHGKKMKMLACRSKRSDHNGGGNGGGETSFRRIQCGSFSEGIVVKNNDRHRNQRWVHRPLMVCETLKGLGSCTSSCFNSGSSESNNKRENVEKESGNCCGVFRLMVSLEGEGKKDIELVVGGVDEEIRGRECSRRRSIFDDVFSNVGISLNDNGNDIDDDNDGGRGEECGRVNVCVPPKNALLLMRCRSDPMRMASISHKFWDPNLVQEDSVEEVVVIKEENDVKVYEKCVVREAEMIEIKEEIVKLGNVGEETDELCDAFEVICPNNQVFREENEEKTEETQSVEEETEEKQSTENSVKEEVLENVGETQLREGLNVADECSIAMIPVEKGEDGQYLDEILKGEEMDVQEENRVLSTDSSTSCTLSEESTAVESKELEPKEEKVKVKGEEASNSTEKEKNEPMLPDCLLLMMCEPKLSMEVSKETWVCKSDFIRYLPERHLNKKPNKTDDSNDQSSNISKRAKPPLPPAAAQGGRSGIQPGRSSISFPTGGVSVANLIEQKLAKAGVGYEPFVLTRCNSAPLRSTAKVEPHRPATCGVGSGRVGF